MNNTREQVLASCDMIHQKTRLEESRVSTKRMLRCWLSVFKEAFAHAGDDYIITPAGSESVVQRLLATHTRLSSTATLIVERVADPRRYRVAEGRLVERGVLRIRNVEEKASKPKTHCPQVRQRGCEA